jgi:hypothetical protein
MDESRVVSRRADCGESIEAPVLRQLQAKDMSA